MNVFVFGTRGFPQIQGGVEVHCEHLYSAMRQADLKVTVFRRKPYVPRLVQPASPGIRFVDLPSTKMKGFEAFFHSLLCCIYCIFSRPDIVHVHNIGPGMFIPILKFFGLKVVLTYHSANYEHDKWGKYAKAILRIAETLSVRFADKIIFVNKAKLNSFPDNIRSKSCYLPNGISPVKHASLHNFLDELGLLPHGYILSVGRITKEKGFDYLIDAYLSSGCEQPLVIVGGIDHSTDYARLVQQKATKSEKIILAGFRQGEELSQLYTFARFFVLPSYNEGYPIVVIEAVNYHKRILLSDIEPNQQINLPAECYFKTGDVEELSKKLYRVASDEYSEPLYEVKLYTWKELANSVYSIYQSICHG